MTLLRLFLTSLLLICSVSQAQISDPLQDMFSEEPQFLPVDQAFAFEFVQKGDQLTLSWQIAEGYYLYKKQFKTVVKDAQLGEPVFPKGKEHEDEFFGVSEVFYQQVDIQYPIIESMQDGVVKIRYQGCADAGLCYPPTTQVVYLQKVDATNQASTDPALTTQTTVSQESPASAQSQQFDLADQLTRGDNLAYTLLLFLGLGVLLAFTPCVFPMYPILSAIVLGQGKQISSTKAFSLSFIYVQGMALTYSVLGLIVASAGVQFQAALQHPAILVTLIVIFVLLALVMFGTWELQLPSKWQEKLNNLSNKQTAGSVVGVFIMGAISGLVASPCTTAPLTGILLFVAQSGDLLLGFAALYVLSLGMGIPLILFALTSGKLLPKAGNWMNVVKVTFGFMMLSVAILFVERMVTNIWTDLAWSLLGLALFSYWQVMNQSSEQTLMKGLRTLVIFLGLFSSALYGYHSLFPQTAQPTGQETTVQHDVSFTRVKDLQDFQTKLAAANAEGKSVMVDLYADWCVACKEFEKYTFPKPVVKKALENTVLMQIDLTDNTAVNLDFQDHFQVLGLPTILFFDTKGNEISSGRITGFMQPEPFARHINAILAE
ncbi:protein-disulfide reductase DsbD [Neptunicella sp. SCSIO 80796]|uniref:protein-disulfide reductase DsbD n=1 Tax=Neptunicella plasticusilytica TaxID=3117012 RepID=UPI003A4DA1B9